MGAAGPAWLGSVRLPHPRRAAPPPSLGPAPDGGGDSQQGGREGPSKRDRDGVPEQAVNLIQENRLPQFLHLCLEAKRGSLLIT